MINNRSRSNTNVAETMNVDSDGDNSSQRDNNSQAGTVVDKNVILIIVIENI